jgi:ELWxxDGT repeat protein
MSSSKCLLWLIVSVSLLAPPVFAQSSADTEPGPARLVADLTEGSVEASQYISGFLQVGNLSVFVRSDHENLPGLWVTDGTAEGTQSLGVLCQPCGHAAPLGSTGSVAFYGVSNVDLVIWRTDGTLAGTFPVTSGLSALPFNQPALGSVNGGRLFFNACSPELGCELWSSDGSVAGTAPVGELVPGPESGVMVELEAAGDRAFLIADSPSRALWLADARGLTRLREAPEARLLTLQGTARAFFFALADGDEVWTSDGTAAGTRPLTSFAPRKPFPEYSPVLTVLDGRARFVANNGKQGVELWSVGALPESLRRLTDFRNRSVAVSDVQTAGGRTVFVAVTGPDGPRLWSSRGDFRSSAPLAGCAGGCPSPASELAPLGPGRFVFYGRNRDGRGIWITDGTAAGTRLLRQIELRHSLSQAVSAGGRALILITEEYEIGELWVTDGTAAGTVRVAEGGPGWSHYYGWGGRLQAGTANGQILFAGATVGGYGEVLWRSDGSPASSRQITDARIGRSSGPHLLTRFRDGLLVQSCAFTPDVYPSDEHLELRFVQGTEVTLLLSQASCYSSDLVALGDTALFLQYLDNQIQLWRTDGTPEGTFALVAGSSVSWPSSPVRFGDEAAFSLLVLGPNGASDSQSQLWLTDGTPEGTRKQLELPLGTEVAGLTSAGGKLWFFDLVQSGVDFSLQTWVSDGTPAGTHVVTGPSGDALDQGSFVEAGGRVYFLFSEPGESSAVIWGSDGTPAGTGPAVTAASGAVAPTALTAAGDRLYFTAPRTSDPLGRLLPWVSDGTDGSTELLANVKMQRIADEQFAMGDRPPFTELDGRVFFAASDLAHGNELWSTDGTPEGTARLEIAPGLLGSYPRGLTVWNGRLWFRARDGVHGMELWTSDGTVEGTRLVQDIAPGASWSTPLWLTGTEKGLYFSAHEGEHGRELWMVPD